MGRVWSNARRVPIALQKEIWPDGKGIHILMEITNLDDQEAFLFFASEWNFYQIEEEFRADESGADMAGGRLRFSFEPAHGFWHFPLQTLSRSEKGYDIIHQGFCLAPNWPIMLPPGETFTARIHIGETRDS
jgi:hypothetical protein